VKHAFATLALVAGATLISMAGPSLAQEPDFAPPPQMRAMAPHFPDDRAPPPWSMDAARRPGPPAGPPPRPAGFELASRLAAAETYIGVRSGQLDAWRGYTAALIDFLDRPAVGPGPQAPAPDAAGKLFAEGLAERAVAEGDKARALQQAIGALRAALDPAQLERLGNADALLLPPPLPPHGHPDRPGMPAPPADGPGQAEDLPPPRL
jgi:hypothetical protein